MLAWSSVQFEEWQYENGGNASEWQSFEEGRQLNGCVAGDWLFVDRQLRVVLTGNDGRKNCRLAVE